MKKKYEEIYFIIGSDLVESLPSWIEGEKLK